MSDFEEAVSLVLRHEGNYVDHPNDPGGATSFGVSLRFLADHPDDGDFDGDGDVDKEDIMNMTLDDAKSIYKKHWWDKYGYWKIPDQTIATKVFDFSVNMGAKRAHVLLQEAMNNAFGLNLTIDGALGPASYQVLCSILDGDQEQQLIDAYCDAAWGFYQRLIENNSKLAVFKKGWKNRAYSINLANSV